MSEELFFIPNSSFQIENPRHSLERREFFYEVSKLLTACQMASLSLKAANFFSPMPRTFLISSIALNGPFCSRYSMIR